MYTKLFGITIYNGSKQKLLTSITNWVNNSPIYTTLVTPNVDHVVKLSEQSLQFQNQYKNSWAVADGMPLVWASKLLTDDPIEERITGTDLIPDLLKLANDHGWRVSIIYSSYNLKELVKSYITTYYPFIKLTGYTALPEFNKNEVARSAIAREMRLDCPDLIFVGLGFPTQERWLFDHGAYTGARLGLGIGAGLEHLVGLKHRAPKWAQQAGLEWCFRALTDPRLIIRYIKDFKFFWLLIKELLK
jgi:N-acetylglucosaminyldiphosphoundecaprenol N-acetyl-beta-D-mannosaminyltransferase